MEKSNDRQLKILIVFNLQFCQWYSKPYRKKENSIKNKWWQERKHEHFFQSLHICCWPFDQN